MIARAIHLLGVLLAIRRETGSNARTLRFLGRLLKRKADRLSQQAELNIRAPHRAKAVMALAQELAIGEPSVAIAISGGIGDFLVIARFIRDFLSNAQAPQFDVFCPNPALASWAFSEVPGFRSCMHDLLFDGYKGFYDVSLRINQFVLVNWEQANWSKLREQPGLVRSIDSIIRYRPKLDPFVECHPYMDNFLASRAVFSNASRRNFLHHIAGCSYGGDKLPLKIDAGIVKRAGLAKARYVTLHNGFDAAFVMSGDWATKCYPHFAAVIAALREQAPDVKFVQIGTVTSKPIEGVDVNLVGQTSLEEVAGLIASAVIHIDIEGGLVHVAACLGVRSCVVFGPTPSNYFGYPGNINIDPVVCGGCWWIKETWMDACPRGFATARCMSEQPPERVAERVAPALVVARETVPVLD
jgi:hypothetical protein